MGVKIGAAVQCEECDQIKIFPTMKDARLWAEFHNLYRCEAKKVE